MNKFIENFLKKTLWIWLPFVAFFRLWKEVLLKIQAWEEERERR